MCGERVDGGRSDGGGAVVVMFNNTPLTYSPTPTPSRCAPALPLARDQVPEVGGQFKLPSLVRVVGKY